MAARDLRPRVTRKSKRRGDEFEELLEGTLIKGVFMFEELAGDAGGKPEKLALRMLLEALAFAASLRAKSIKRVFTFH